MKKLSEKKKLKNRLRNGLDGKYVDGLPLKTSFEFNTFQGRLLCNGPEDAFECESQIHHQTGAMSIFPKHTAYPTHAMLDGVYREREF